jgi:hypothetical protein
MWSNSSYLITWPTSIYIPIDTSKLFLKQNYLQLLLVPLLCIFTTYIRLFNHDKSFYSVVLVRCFILITTPINFFTSMTIWSSRCAKHPCITTFIFINMSLETRSSNNPLAFLWALIVLLFWQIYSYIHMRQNLFRNVKLIRYQFWCTRCAFRLIKSLQWCSGRKSWKSPKMWYMWKSRYKPNRVSWNWAKSVEG